MTYSTTPELVFKNPAASVTIEPAGYVCLTWHSGQHDSRIIREVFDQSFLVNQNTKLGKILFDQRLAAPFTEADKQWFVQVFAPRFAAQSQQTRFAHVVAMDVFARLSMAPMAASIHQQGDWYKSFNDFETGISWLLA